MPTTSLARMDEESDVAVADELASSWARRWLQSRDRTFGSSERDFDAAIDALSRRLTGPHVRTLDDAIDPALATLGEGLVAERVEFFAAASIQSTLHPEKGFSLSRRWSARGQATPPPILASPFDIESHPLIREAFEQGHAYRSSPDPTDSPGAWIGTSATVIVPCPSPSGLLGFVVIEAGLAARRWSERTLERAEAVGRWLGLSLDRLRLEKETERRREEDAHRTRLELIGRVTSSSAHDLNNILTAILGYGDLLDMELGLESGDPGHEELEEMRYATKRAAAIADDLLRFGRRREDGSEIVDLGETVQSLRGMLRQVLGRGITLDVDPDPRSTPVRIDPGRFENVLLNLAANARAATGDGGHFSLTTREVAIDSDARDISAESEPIRGLRAGRYVRLTARDDGRGIAPDVLPRIFEPFFTTKAPGKGTGLGLPSIAEFVKSAKGGVRVESEAGEGTAIHLYLPLLLDAIGD